MKKLSILGFAMMLAGSIACTKDPIASPLASVKAQDGAKEVAAAIDHSARTVKFDKFTDVEDFAAVKVSMAAAEGAILVSPGAESVVDFSKQPVEVIVNDGVADVKYLMTAAIPDPFTSVKVGEKEAVVDGINISLPYDKATMNVTKIKVDIALRKGAEVMMPKDLVFDFSMKLVQGLKIKYMNKEFMYQVRLEGYDPNANPLTKAGWVVINESYGSLPEHITIYSNNKLGKTKDQTAYIAEIGKGAKMLALGNGNSKYKSISEATKLPETKDYPILVNGISGINQAIVSEGKFVYASGATYPVLAQNEDGTFVLAPQKRVPLATAPWWKPFSSLLEPDGKTVVQQEWCPKNMIGGYYMVIANGKAMTAAEMGNTGLYNNWFDGDAVHAREFIGLTKDGKVIIAVCGRGAEGTGGLSMKEMVEIMLTAGCDRAMTLEGSDSANMLINGKRTDEFNDGSKVMRAIVCFK